MAQKTDLNVTPYYDDFDETDQFHKVLFRPGLAVQARELTQLQSILQNQIERFGNHMFKEGTIVIPGNISYDSKYYAVKLQSSYNSVATNTYLSEFVGKNITGNTSGVTAKVVHYVVTDGTDPDTLFVKYTGSATADSVTPVFSDEETLDADATISGAGSPNATGNPIAQLQATGATATGAAVHVAEGVYFIRGMFVRNTAQTLVLDNYTNTPSYRVGWTVTETLVTPESDSQLLDNASGSTNYAAKGSHRLKLTLTLAKKSLTATDDTDFIELLRVDSGVVHKHLRHTEYSVVSDMIARRTHDESGDYVVNPWHIDAREHLNDGVNRGIYTTAQDGSASKLAYAISSGKGYIRGRGIETISPTYVATNKARDTDSKNNDTIPFSLGNYVEVTKVFGSPDVSDGAQGLSTVVDFKLVKLYDTATATRGTAEGALVGQARSRGFEYNSGTVGASSSNTTSKYKHYLFDVNMFTLITMSGNVSLTANVKVTGVTSGATGVLFVAVSSATDLILMQTSGAFVVGEEITSSDGTDTISGNPTISSITLKQFDRDVKQIFMTQTAGSGKDYTADTVLGTAKTLSGTYKTETGTTNANLDGWFYQISLEQTSDYNEEMALEDGYLLLEETDGDNILGETESGGDSLITEDDDDIISESYSLLAEALDSSETGVDVDDVTEFAVGQVILLGSEQMKITAISSNTLTVTRGFNGTTAATHSDTTQVELLDHLIGISGYDTSEVVVGDTLTIPTGSAGATQERTVMYVASTYISFTAAPSTDGITTANVIRNRTKLTEQEETLLVYKLPKNDVKTLLDTNNNSDTTYSVRRTFIGTTNGSSVVTFTSGANETFAAYSDEGYTCTIMTASGTGGAAAQGDIVPLSASILGGEGTNTLTVTDTTNIKDAAQIKLIATVLRTVATHKAKTASKCKIVTIAKDASTGGYTSDIYGARVGDNEIGLTYADAYKLRAVYESTAITTAPSIPTLTIANRTGAFTAGEIITGSNSAAKGVVIDNTTATTLTYVVTSGTFNTSDTITGGTSGNTANVGAIAAGSSDITSSFSLDTGQRDSFYDISRLVRKTIALTPTGQLTVVFDYFAHSGTGDYFSVDSYTNQVDYEDIPDYSATKVDPETLAPKGFYELRDSLDFRPRVADNNGSSTAPFSFSTRVFEGTGSSIGDLIIPDDTMRVDYTFYLPRRDLLFVDSQGNFEIIEGVSHEQPQYPGLNDREAMKLATIHMHAYTYDDNDILITPVDNRRYTMRDIGRLEARLANVEYYTTLGLLEKDTASFEILDANGLNRFKSGFIVDNFSGHRVGDSHHDDYQSSVDPRFGHLRPEVHTESIKLIEENTTDSERTADSYIKKGDLILLPYTHKATMQNPYSSRVESINPFLVTTWIGELTLDPEQDIWVDTNRMPEIVIDVEGNYEQMLREKRADGTIEDGETFGTVYGAWQDVVGGKSVDAGRRWVSGEFRSGWQIRRRSIATVRVEQSRTVTTTRLVEQIDRRSLGDKVLNTEIIPWIRDSVTGTNPGPDVVFTGRCLKPNTRVFVFFDGTDVNAYCAPTASSAQIAELNGAHSKTATTITVDSTTGFPTTGTILIGSEQMTYTGVTSTTFTGVTRNSGAANYQVLVEASEHADGDAISGAVNSMPLITDEVGTVVGTFQIPNTSSLRFKVGKRVFRLTDSPTDVRTGGIVNTAAEDIYEARGTLEKVADQILSTRNAKLVVDPVTHQSGMSARRDVGATRDDHIRNIPRPDPLAQTFKVGGDGGEFLTKVDLYFYSKETSRPVTVDIRTVENGYPTQVKLPFSTVIKDAVDIITTSDATTPTTFEFPSPVYVNDQDEYALVISGQTDETKVWISRMGEIDTGGARAISEQPHLGTLFKSQNASTWSPSQYEDLKFTMYRAEFDTTKTSTYTVVNEEGTAESGHIGLLTQHPIQTKVGTATIKVKYRNHGMYDTDNNVVISGMISDVVNTTLNEVLTTSDTTISITDASNFPSAGTIKIDDEIITYTGKSTNDLTGCIRGASDGTSATTAATHENASVVALYMLGGIPLTEINKTHTSISGIELDHFIITCSTNATSTLQGGGSTVRCSRNVMMDLMQIQISNIAPVGTNITTRSQTTTGRSVNTTSALQDSFTRTTDANAFSVPINQNVEFTLPNIVCSQINETNELSGDKSIRITNYLTSTKSNLSPVIDVSTQALIAVGNRVNSISSSSDVSALTTYKAPTSPLGDQNAAIYMTKKVTLASAATAIKVILDGVVQDESRIECMYKIIRADATEDFDDIGWTFFNTDGSSDSTVPTSKHSLDFKEYQYTVSNLQDFVGFSIKVIMQGTNSARPPIIKDFRAIALAT
tara:strand:- start:303 stop:7325 length:7023 start_codon:yes stop_codon:yes gene_type:complete